MGRTLTLISDDGEFKVDLRAWKDHWGVYASIGSQADVYRRQETNNVWGQPTVDWMRHEDAAIMISNTYRGQGHEIARVERFRGSHGEQRLWATGFLSISVHLDQEEPSHDGRPNLANIPVDSVEAQIVVQVGRHALRGTVTASTAVVDQSIW
jgi:hypothetical protein